MGIRHPAPGETRAPKFRKLRIIWAGLRHAVANDFSVAYKLVLSAALLGVFFWLRQWLDLLLIVVVTGLVLVAEILNTAIEGICDFIEPGRDDRIKAIKDVAAAGVGMSIATWMVVVVAELWRLLASLPLER